MLNPYLIIGALLVLLGAFGSGVSVGRGWEEGRNAIEQNHIAEAVDAANGVSAEAIAKIKVTHRTIQNEVRHELEKETVYSECRLTPNGLQLANQALLGGTKPAGEGKLPRADEAAK